MKQKIDLEIESLKEWMIESSDWICDHPELGNQEVAASECLIKFLKSHGFRIEQPICNKRTAFKATFDSGIEGPVIAYLAEYDALPEIGHGCGHNMIGVMGTAAAVGLSKVINETGGSVLLIGTPAEETDGAKVEMTHTGVFDDVDVAMILHPAGMTHKSGRSLAIEALEFSFRGKTSHAAATPHEGINALDAVILTFNGINALRQQVTQDVRIHGIIKEGGVAANIIPDLGVAQFYVRAASKGILADVVDKVKKIAEGAALMTGAILTIRNYEISYDEMKTNEVLSEIFTNNLKSLGIENIQEPSENFGSIDMGNVSHRVPAIHPYLSITGEKEIAAHTVEFREATKTDEAHHALMIGAKALAYSGLDLLVRPDLFKKVQESFE